MNSDSDLNFYLNQLKKKTKKLQYTSQSEASSSSSEDVEISSKVRGVPTIKSFSSKTDKLSLLHQKYVRRLPTSKDYITDSESISMSSIVAKTPNHMKEKVEYEKVKSSSQSSSVQTTDKDLLDNLMTVDDLLQQYNESEKDDSSNHKSHETVGSNGIISNNESYNYYNESFHSEQESEMSEQIEEDIQIKSSIYSEELATGDGNIVKYDITPTNESDTQENSSLTVIAVTDSNLSAANTLMKKVLSHVSVEHSDVSSDKGINGSVPAPTLHHMKGFKLDQKNKKQKKGKDKGSVKLLKSNVTSKQIKNVGESDNLNENVKYPVYSIKHSKKMKKESEKKNSSSSMSCSQKYSRKCSHNLDERVIVESLTEVLPRILPGILNNMISPNYLQNQVHPATLQPAFAIKVEECLRQTMTITKQLLESHMKMYDTYQKTISSSRELANLKLTEEYIHTYKNLKSGSGKIN